MPGILLFVASNDAPKPNRRCKRCCCQIDKGLFLCLSCEEVVAYWSQLGECPNCTGHINQARKSKFCPHCGVPLRNPKPRKKQ